MENDLRLNKIHIQVKSKQPYNDSGAFDEITGVNHKVLQLHFCVHLPQLKMK